MTSIPLQNCGKKMSSGEGLEMIRLNIVVEGQTEEEFVKSSLAPHLGLLSVFAVARSVETSRRRSRIYRGGLLDYARAKRDIARWMKEDNHPEALFTTMFDLFRLPSEFPGYERAKQSSDPFKRVAILEEAFQLDMGSHRFIPYIQLHEYEALLFSDPSRFSLEFLNREREVQNLIKIGSAFQTPELIDDGPTTSPSKRIIQEIPEYEGRKVSAGPHVAREIGLPAIRKKCSHFNEWLSKLESSDSIKPSPGPC